MKTKKHKLLQTMDLSYNILVQCSTGSVEGEARGHG